MNNIMIFIFFLSILLLFLLPFAAQIGSSRYRRKFGKPGVEIFHVIDILKNRQTKGDLILRFSFGKAAVWKQCFIIMLSVIIFLYIYVGLKVGFDRTLLGVIVILGILVWVIMSLIRIYVYSYRPSGYELYTEGFRLTGGTHYVNDIFIDNNSILWAGFSSRRIHRRIAVKVPSVIFYPDRIITFNRCLVIFSYDNFIYGLTIFSSKKFIKALLDQYPALVQKSLDEVLQIQSEQSGDIENRQTV